MTNMINKLMNLQDRRQFLRCALGCAAAVPGCARTGGPALLHVSYDATRELFRRLNRLFLERRQQEGKDPLRIRMSHGGSGSQARAVIDGLGAHVVSLALWLDVDAIARAGLMAPDWENRFPNRSLPYTSTVVFVVRAGNPLGITDWPDLVRHESTQIIMANPKTSGAARLNVLAAWLGVVAAGGSAAEAREFLRQLLRRVPIFDSSSRAAAVSFARRHIGDVLLTWENEAWLVQREVPGQVEIVYPKLSVVAEPHVAIVDAHARRDGLEMTAEQYVRFLYTPEAQEVFAHYHFRPYRHEAGAALSPIRLLRPTDPQFGLGDWHHIQQSFFQEGALYDQITQSI